MKNLIVGVSLSVFLFTSPALTQTDVAWLRVLSEDYLLIDVRRTSLILEKPNVVSAEFRTTLPRSEPLVGKRGIEYRFRLDRIEFDLQGRRYRISKSAYFDRSQNVVFETSGGEWKPMAGRTGDRLFRTTVQLSPFGAWKAVSYRYASGEPPAADDPAELKDLVGSDLFFRWDEVRMGKSSCRAPVYEPKHLSNEDSIRLLGSDLSSLGFSGDRLRAMVIKCGSEPQFPQQTLVLFSEIGKAVVLWEGVLFEIERPPNPFR